MAERIDTVVVGAGHAGLAVSSCLAKNEIEHIVLERGDVAQRSARSGGIPSFSSSRTGRFSCQATPIREATPMGMPQGRVHSISGDLRLNNSRAGPTRNRGVALSDSKDCRLMTLETSRGIIHTKECRGGYRAVPSSQNPSCKSRSTARDPSDARARLSQARQLPPGAVLVVGSGALGTQIAEELHRSGRKVFSAVGRFHKTPRRYRSRDFYWWFEKLGYWHTPLTSILQKRRACVSS